MMHHSHAPHHTHVHQVNVHPPMHPQHPPMNMNVGQQVPHQHHISNINVSVPPPVPPQPNSQHNIQRDQNRLNQHQHRINTQMHQPPPSHHGRHNVHSGIKNTQYQQKNVPHVQNANSSSVVVPLAQQPHQQQQQQQQQHSQHSHQTQPQIQRNIKNIENSTSKTQSGQIPPTVSTTAATSTPTIVPPENNVIEVSAAGDQMQHTLVETLANSKEKTPMCLVNELARFNKIQHQYRLTGEQGPAHKKRFTVTLKLGEEEYTSEGASIKKAQHSAAGEAISKTKYEHPPAKTNRMRNSGRVGGGGTVDDLGNITPTVELNALAMKRGEPTVYIVDPPTSVNNTMLSGPQMAQGSQQLQFQSGMPPNQFIPSNHNQNNYNHNQYGNYHHRNNSSNIYQPQRYSYDRRHMGRGGFAKMDYTQRYQHYNYSAMGSSEDPYKVTLQVGQRKFVGIGNTLQSARHDAASKALEVLKPITPEDDATETTCDEDLNSELKSPISLVHEMALKRNLTVTFEVQSEKGPPHMKTFVTLCIVGNITTEGEGNGKKLSKKRAAENMLQELKKLPPASPIQSRVKQFKRKPQPIKKKTRNLIKEHPEEGVEDINPISRLIHISQGNKAKDPVYTLVEEKGAPRRREFVMEVHAVGQKAQGIGPTKKFAKRQAAENLLSIMGFPRTISPIKEILIKPAITNNTDITEKSRKVTFQENTETVPSPTPAIHGGSAGRQLVPGLLLMQQENTGFCTTNKSGINNQTTATIAKELLNAGTSPTADALAKSGGKTQIPGKQSPIPVNKPSSDGIRPKDQLMYLAQLLGFQVQFSDFPKGNHGEFLTLITLSTEPPQLCHGAGSSTDASHDQAAVTALKMLSELGLDNVKPNKTHLEDKKIKPILSNGIKK